MPTTPEVWLNEFQANTTETGTGGSTQNESTIIQLTNGNIVVLWTDDSDGGPGGVNGTDIIGQIYDPLGNAIGGEFRANQGAFVSDENTFSAAALDNGSFVLVFEQNSGADTNTSINTTEWQTNASGVTTHFSQIIASAPGGGDIVGGPTVSGNTTDGSYAVGYSHFDSSASDTDVRFKMVDAAGSLGSEIVALSGSDFRVEEVDSAILSNGNHVFVHAHGNGGDDAIVYTIRSSTGGLVRAASFVVDTGVDGDSDRDPSVIGLTGGGFVVAWVDVDSDTDVLFQRYDNAGVPQGPLSSVNSNHLENNNEVQLVALADGGFVAIYDNDVASTIDGQRFDAVGTTVGNSFTISNSQNVSSPSGIGLEDGRFVVGWTILDGVGSNVEVEFHDPRDTINNGVYSPDQWQIGTIGSELFTAESSGLDFNAKVHGWDGNDIITENGGTKKYYGDDGDDVIIVTSLINSDLHDGGTGIDTIDWRASLQTGAIFDLNLGIATDSSGNVEQMRNFENLIGTNDADIIIGTSGADALLGGTGDDTIDGGAGDDRLGGGLDTDTLSYASAASAVTVDLSIILAQNTIGAGTDIVLDFESLTGSDFADTLTGDGADNIVNGGLGNDSINGGDGNDEIHGGDGDDFIVVGLGSDMAFGGAGNDTIRRQVGAALEDEYYGGTGIDTIDATNYGFSSTVVFDLAAGEMTFNGSLYSIFEEFENYDGSGGIGVESVIGTSGDNVITTGSGQNTINGGGGNDTINAGGGDDSIVGGLGDDLLNGEAGVDSLNGQAGVDVINGGLGDDTLQGGLGNDTLNGNAHNDTLFGQADDDVLNGGAGADVLHGQAGADQLDGGAGDDEIHADSADTLIQGGSGFDYVHADSGQALNFDVSAANVEWVWGHTGADILDASSATTRVVLHGRGNADILTTGSGDDTIIGGFANDTINGGGGNDRLYGQTQDDTINGGTGNDVLYGQQHNDILNAGTGRDFLFGGTGDDTLTGGGADLERDLFVFQTAGGIDTITDYEDGVDLLQFRGVVGANSFASLSIANNLAGDAEVTYVGGVITFIGIDQADLTTADFIFA